jgi:hypothetical protein
MSNRFFTSLSVAIVAATCSLASISTSPAYVQLKVVDQSGAPAKLSNVAIENDTGREISLIRYQVVNESKRALKRVFLKMVFFDSFGQPVGGETFSEEVSLKRHRRAEFITPLKHYAPNGERIAVTLSAVETDSDTWRSQSDTKQLLEEMKKNSLFAPDSW